MRPEINFGNDDGDDCGDDMGVNRPFCRWATVTLSEREIALLGYFVSSAIDEAEGELSDALMVDLENLQTIFGELF